MSTKAKIGKEWVKCQLVLKDTGETLHLTFAPGEKRKKVVAHIDGRTDTGYIELTGLAGAQAPYDATLSLSLEGTGVRHAKPAAAAPSKPAVAPPVPAPVAAVAAPAPAAAPAAPKPVVPEAAPASAASEESAVPEVQDPAADATSAAGGKRGRKPAVQLPE